MLKFLVIPISLFLIHCGPTEPVVKAPNTIEKNLVIKSNRFGTDQVNRLVFKEPKNGSVVAYFEHSSNKTQQLFIDSFNLDVEKEANCNFTIDSEWGVMDPSDRSFSYREHELIDPMDVIAGLNYRLKWSINNLKDCGEFALEFAVRAN